MVKQNYKKFCNSFYESSLDEVLKHALYNLIWIEKEWTTVGAWSHWSIVINDYEDTVYYNSDLENHERYYDDIEKLLKDLFEAYC